MKKIAPFAIILVLLQGCSTREESKKTDSTPAFPLKAYVEAGDKAFRYEVIDSLVNPDYKEYKVRLISGTWLTENEVENPEWWHWLNIIVPRQLKEDEGLMIIGGGDAQDQGDLPSEQWLIDAAISTGSVISQVSNIPFQPIDFKGDQKEGRYEDDLIAYGWKVYLESGAADSHLQWLARFPMTRAVIRAMDVVQELTAASTVPVREFFVTGASKRGWTTWTTAAVDDRVIGIAPIVIDLLNIVPSFQHHWQCYGEWSPAVEDYVEEGIMDWMGSTEFGKLLDMVGPYSFIESLTIPKLLINATCDEFFVTDSWQFYWDDLEEDKYLLYVPNGNHGLRGTYQPESLISFYHYVIADKTIPEFSWDVRQNSIQLQVEPGSDYIINKWEAVNDSDRDFRIYVIGEDAWKKEEISLAENGSYSIPFPQPQSGYKAGLVELVFFPESEFPLYFTSGTIVTPDTYPFGPFESNHPKGTYLQNN
jgi:PhoPQ-activated pathogenicity-related protein